MTMTKMKLVPPALVLGLSLTLAACGSSGGHDMGSMSTPAASSPATSGSPATSSSPATSGASATPATGPHNEANVMFASMMIPHHSQAVEMAEMVLAKSDIDPKVTNLAQRIKGAQGPEIAQMRGGWLVGARIRTPQLAATASTEVAATA